MMLQQVEPIQLLLVLVERVDTILALLERETVLAVTDQTQF